ncbi:MAG TPA: hypothetical protein VKE70_05170 [Candidatus Solibacter sp.]|nr:hypothetical protein [Candidatus Solibacter sp.]
MPVAKAFSRRLTREEIYANQYWDFDHLRANIQEFIKQYYHRCRLHSVLGDRPPEEFEQAAELAAATSAGATMSFFRHEEIYRSDGEFLIDGKRYRCEKRIRI